MTERSESERQTEALEETARNTGTLLLLAQAWSVLIALGMLIALIWWTRSAL